MSMTIDELSELIYYRNVGDFQENVKNLKENISKLNSSDYSLLHVAAKVEDSEIIIEHLIELGIDVNIRDLGGNTPLMISANYNCPKNLKTLLQNKANTSLFNNDLNSALHLSCAGNHLESTKVLIQNGANPNADAGNKKTPLINAIKGKPNLKIIDLLLSNGADINYGNGNATPLMFAISYKNLELVKYLLDRGAEINGFTNRAGETTIQYAERVGDGEILKYLKDWKTEG